MEVLYHETNRIIQDIQQAFQQLNSSQVDAATVEHVILTRISAVNA